MAVPLMLTNDTNSNVMEASACGMPIVPTPVRCQGLALQDGSDLLVRTAAAEFADAICELLSDAGRASALGLRARATAEARFSWNAVADRAWESYQLLLEVESR